MFPALGWVTIRSKMHGKVLDVYGASSQQGTKVVVWPQKSPLANNQIWRFEACGDGWYHIVSALRTNLVLDVDAGKPRDGAPLIVWERKSPPAPNQKFRLNGNRLESALADGLMVDIKGSNKTDGANVILWPANNAINQAFDIQQVVGGSWTAPLAFDHAGSWVVIRSQMNGKVMDAEGGRAKPGTPILMWDQNYTTHQKWRFEACEGGIGWFHIVSALDSKLVMNVKDGLARPGAPIILWDRQSPATMNEIFRMKGHCIESALGGKLVLDVQGQNNANGAKIIVFPEKTAGNMTNQAFVLQAI